MAHRCAILWVGMAKSPEDGSDKPRLDSWKEIASYLGAAFAPFNDGSGRKASRSTGSDTRNGGRFTPIDAS